MSTIIYNYNPKTKEFLYQSFADENPINADEPIIPAFATTIKPLKKKDNKAIVWVGNKWEYKEDHRGEVWYNAQISKKEIISFIGELPSYYYSLDSNRANKPEGDYWEYDSNSDSWVGNLNSYKIYIEKTLPSIWKIKQNTPFIFKEYRFLPNWREQYMSIWSSLNSGLKNEFKIKDYDGKSITVTKNDFKPIIKKIVEINDAMVLDKQSLKDCLNKSKDFNQLQKKYNDWLNKIYD